MRVESQSYNMDFSLSSSLLSFHMRSAFGYMTYLISLSICIASHTGANREPLARIFRLRHYLLPSLLALQRNLTFYRRCT